MKPEIVDTGKRCSGCAFWVSSDRKTGVCTILVEDDRTPFMPPAEGYCTEHKDDTMTASAIRRHAAALQAENAKLREALKPFAEEASNWQDDVADGEEVYTFSADVVGEMEEATGISSEPSPIIVGHFRRAEALLKETAK